MVVEAVTTAVLAGLFYLILRRSRLGQTPPFAPPPARERREPTAEEKTSALFAEGEAHLKAGRFSEAEAKFRSVERVNPKYPKLKNRLGIVFLEKGDYKRAVEAFEQAVREDPQIPSRHLNLAMAYKAMNKYSLAKRSLEKAIELAPENTKYQLLIKELEEEMNR